MSYMDEYNKLKKKRLEEENKASAKVTNSGTSRYMSEYEKFRSQSRLANFDNIINRTNDLGTTTKETESKKEKETKKPWHKTGHFEDGYDFGDVTKTILGIGEKKDTVSTSPAEKLESLYSVYGTEDFTNRSGYVSTKAEGFWDKFGSKYGMGYNDLQYEYINNQNGIRDEIDSKAISFGADSGKTTSSYKEKALDYMTDDEVAVYNYYYQTEGKEKAQEFLDALAETLSARKAGEDFEGIEGKTGREILYGIVSGNEQFKQGVKNVGNMIVGKDDYIPQTSTQILSGMIREDLAGDEDSTKVFGNSFAQVGFDILNTGTNMIPSIAVGVANPVAGAALMGASAAGNSYQEALNEGHNKDGAKLYATTIGVLEGTLQYALGGIGKLGGTSKAITRAVSGIKNGALRFSLEYGGKIASEAVEEGLQEVLDPIVKNAILDTDESINWEEVAYSALLGGVMGGAFGASEVSQSHLSANEQAVLDKVYNDAVAEKEKNGKLSSKEKNKIYDAVVKDMELGRIDTDTIESVLGGESYKGYQSMLEQETSIKEEIEALENTPESQFTVKQRERLTELREQLKGIDTKTAKSDLFAEVDKLTENDTKLRESYNERARRGFAFEADLSQYDAKQQETIKRAVESGILNNTRRTHEFVDLVAKISAEKGVLFDFTNNQKLKESGFALNGKQVNGFVTKDGITINVNSAKSLDTVVGHEITHVLEGTELYNELQTAIVKYAKDKGDYQGRYDTLAKLYENVEGANIDSELTAELVGDYIFTDTDFIHNLSTNHRNVFQKIYDEVKYLYKLATAGSKEARELEKVKKVFDEAYRNSKGQKYTADGGVKYSLNIEHADGTIEELADLRDLTDEQTISYLNAAKSRELIDETYIPVRKETPQVIIDTMEQVGEHLENHSLVMNVYKARKAMKSEGANRSGKKHGSNKRNHKLTPDQIVEIINKIDNPVMMIYQTNRVDDNGNPLPNNVAIFVEYSADGTEGFATVEFENPKREAAIGREFGEVNFYVVNTAFIPDTERNGLPFDYASDELLENPDNILLEIKRKQPIDSADGPIRSSTTAELLSSDKVAEKQAEVKRQFSLSNSLGYHAGDLGKSEHLGMISADRNTGHFGTGTYFVGNPDKLKGYNSRDGKPAPVESVDFDNYKLFKPLTNSQGRELHDFLKGVNSYYSRDNTLVQSVRELEQVKENIDDLRYEVEELDNTIEEISVLSEAMRVIGKDGVASVVQKHLPIDAFVTEDGTFETADGKPFTIIDALEMIEDYSPLNIDLYDEVANDWTERNVRNYEKWLRNIDFNSEFMFRTSPEQVNNILSEIRNEIEAANYNYNTAKGQDSASTRFMKKLGYEGIDVQHLSELDDTYYGSVIYDLKGKDLDRKQEIGTARYSLSDRNDVTPTGKFLGKDMALETAPVAEATEADVAPTPATISETETVEDYAPGESLEEQLAKADDALESLDSETEALFRDLSSQNISEADFETKWRDLDKRYTEARNNQERLSAEMTDINNRKYESIEDSDIPPEMEAPYYGESESVAPVDPFAERDMVEVGKRNVKAYMTEHPEVKPYFQDAARGMLFDLQNGTRGERIFNEQLHYESGYEKGWMGTKRRTTSDIADLLDLWGYTYDQIEAGLNAIIEDNGKVNNAVSKRIEFMLDNRLRNGYTDVEGRPIPAEDGYINLLQEMQIDDYRRESFDSFMEVADQYAPPAEDIDTTEDIAPLKEEPAIEGEQNALDGFEQTEQAPERLTRAKLHGQIVDNVKAEFARKGLDFDEVLKNAHRMNALSINDNTPQRVNDKTFGYEAGEVLNELTFNRVALRESNGVKWLNQQVDTIRKLSKKYKIKPLSKESAAAQMYAEGFWVNENDEIIAYGDAELAQDFPDVQVQNRIKALANDPTIRKIYDDTLTAINESRTRNAYPEIPRLENYYLHFRAMDDTFSRLGVPFNPNDIKAKDLPTDINGTTIDRKPGQPFFASSMHREGKRTSFDLFGGLEKYLNSAKNQIYHIDDIQTERALWSYIADRFGQAHGLENLDQMELEAQQEHIQQVYDGHLSNYARFLMEHANNLAGKTALIDRGVEGLIGRRALQFINTVNTQTSRNQVGYSISSPLTNFIPTMEVIARTSKRDSIKAFAQTVSNVFRKDGFVENDPTLIRRKGTDKFAKTLWEKMSDPGYILMGAVDDVTSQFIVRTKYNELTRKGMNSAQAHVKAGEWAMRVMGDRSLGQTPLLYNSKFMGLFTKYQLEVRNALDSQFYDTYQEAKSNTEIENQKAKNAVIAAKFAYRAAQIAVLNHVFGMAFQKIAGYNPAFDIVSTIATLFGWDDDEEDEDTFGDNANQAFKELLGDLPYTSLFTDGGRIPIGSAMPIKQLISGIDKYGNEKSRWETLAEAAPYYLLPGGYSQIKKTTQGLGMFSDEHPVSGSYTDSGNLRFPVEDTFGNKLQAALFGQYASENARDYFDNERSPLKEKQIQEFIDVDIPIQEYWDYREGLAKFDTNAEKVDYIDSLDLPLSKKNILVNNVLDRKEDVDMENYSDYGSLEEFDFATKYPEKYRFLEDNGVTYEQYSKFDEDTKDAYNWAFENPEKYTMSQAISDDLVEYKSYTKGLDDIKADKDENGKSINGSRKEKVIAYIESLPLDYGQKCILFKSQYKSDDSINMDIIEYLDSREDINYEEMVTILRELDFTVEGNNVYWD